MDEAPRTLREANWNYELGQPLVPPGSAEEEHALAEIDALRAEEERALADTQEARRRRHARAMRRQLNP